MRRRDRGALHFRSPVELVRSQGDVVAADERVQLSGAVTRADASFSALPFDDDCSLDAIVAYVERERGTKVNITPLETLRGTSTCGLVVRRHGMHHIFYVPETSPLHRLQCVLHELSHVLLRHDESSPGSVGQLARFVPDIRLERGDAIFGRVAFEDETEVEAERLADRLAAAIRRPRRHPLEEHFG
ncbi:hypothetical protein [Agromyces sp. NDB4Y10]|uniref:hypothetical protein n=1 Tax=Agromyces sp. NDB4Y10 TaxID=1775951 RepID=UPI0008354A4C|nr:hypothetical protein [Agromyces sp. NDB4Y10]